MNAVAWAMGGVVIVAILGLLAFQWAQARAAERRARDPATLIGSGIGNLVSGIVAAATGSGGQS